MKSRPLLQGNASIVLKNGLSIMKKMAKFLGGELYRNLKISKITWKSTAYYHDTNESLVLLGEKKGDEIKNWR